MLSKKNRANKKDIDSLFKLGKFINSPSLNFRYFKNNSREIKISFIAPKSVAKSAVKRNYLRRCGYKALEKHINKSPSSLLGVFVFKKYQGDILVIENEIKNILNKIN